MDTYVDSIALDNVGVLRSDGRDLLRVALNYEATFEVGLVTLQNKRSSFRQVHYDKAINLLERTQDNSKILMTLISQYINLEYSLQNIP